MQFTKNKLHQYLFFFILLIYFIFNGGNSNLLIQINFILTAILFVYSINDKNYKSHLINFFTRNKISIYFYFLFLSFIFIQFVPLPTDYIKFISYKKYEYLNLLSSNLKYSTISLSQSDTFFQFLNYFSLIIILFIIKMIFYKSLHVKRFYIFLSTVGALFSVFAVIMYLSGNPDFFFIINVYHYKDSSTGFFINRTVFSIFLLFCLLASLELQKFLIIENKKNHKDNFFLNIYTRFFILFITLGIVTSFSRIGNFLLLFTIFSYLINELLNKKKNNFHFRLLLFAIIVFDIIILGLFFGSSKLFDRFAFIQNEFSYILSEDSNLSRFQIIKFAYEQISNFILFGYGAGGFETLFKISFTNDTTFYADHAHASIIEFFGEFGIFGISLLILSLIKILFFLNYLNLINFILLIYLTILLLFDFSFHIPLIQVLFVIFYVLNFKTTRLNSHHL